MRADALTWEGHLRVLEDIYFAAIQIMTGESTSQTATSEMSVYEKYSELWSEYSIMVSSANQLPPVSSHMEDQISEQLSRIRQILVPLRNYLEAEKSKTATAMNRISGQKSLYSNQNQFSGRLNAIL